MITHRPTVWKIFAALILLPILVMWYLVVHQDDEILALVRNDVATDAGGQRVWSGSFVNTNDSPLLNVGVTVDFLDARNLAVGKVDAEAARLSFGQRLELKSPLPSEAIRLRIHTVKWRMGDKSVDLGPFRDPWEFGYLMVDPSSMER